MQNAQTCCGSFVMCKADVRGHSCADTAANIEEKMFELSHNYELKCLDFWQLISLWTVPQSFMYRCVSERQLRIWLKTVIFAIITIESLRLQLACLKPRLSQSRQIEINPVYNKHKPALWKRQGIIYSFIYFFLSSITLLLLCWSINIPVSSTAQLFTLGRPLLITWIKNLVTFNSTRFCVNAP